MSASNEDRADSWHRLFARHQQLESVLGNGIPALNQVAVCQLLFGVGGGLNFSADLRGENKALPKRWQEKGLTQLQLRFGLTLISPPCIHGIPLISSECEIRFADKFVSIRALDASWSLESEAFLESVHVVPYEEQGPGHGVSWFSVQYRG